MHLSHFRDIPQVYLPCIDHSNTILGSNMQCSGCECDETAIHACKHVECSNMYFCECCDEVRHRHKTRRNHLRVLLIKHAENIALKNGKYIVILL